MLGLRRRALPLLLTVLTMLANACGRPEEEKPSHNGDTAAPAEGQPEQETRDEEERWARLRHEMVENQIKARGITNELVLRAMEKVPRHLFVPESWRDSAYGDWALPIGEGQTISQPYIVAFMTQAIDPSPDDRVLDVGTGSGYQAAVLAEIVREVYTIEINPVLAARARELLTRLGYKNIFFRVGDGWLGWPEAAPFDGIIVAAYAPEVPAALVEQLAPGGKLVMPVGGDYFQHLVRVTKDRDGTVHREIVLPDVRFVPLVKTVQSEDRKPAESSAHEEGGHNQ